MFGNILFFFLLVVEVDVFTMECFEGEAQDERFKSTNGEQTLKHEFLTLKLFTVLHNKRFS